MPNITKTIRFDADLWERAAKAAKQSYRSTSSIIEEATEVYLNNLARTHRKVPKIDSDSSPSNTTSEDGSEE